MRDTEPVLKKVGTGRHVVVGICAVGIAALGAFGVIGAGESTVFRPEHFDAKQVTVSPAGEPYPEGVRIREVVDIDFGLNERRGYQRIIPHDFGEPVEITASSPDADDSLDVVDFGVESRIRIGDPFTTYTGQRRYLLEYTLPEARLSTGELALDIIGREETFVTDEFTVVVSGFDFTATQCDVGSFGAFGGCELERTGDATYTTVIDPLAPGDGITVGGPFDQLVDATLPDVPAPPDRNPSGLRPVAVLILLAGAATAFLGYRRFHRIGSNEVYGGGGAADAAFGTLPVPQSGDPVHDVPTHRVPDGKLADLATIEFVPPRGLEPWHGRVLLREDVDNGAVIAWFSELVAEGAMVVEESDDDDATLTRGDDGSRLSASDRKHVDRIFRTKDSIELGKYNSAFSDAWDAIKKDQKEFAKESGWWDPPFDAPLGKAGHMLGTVGFFLFGGLIFAQFLPAWFPTIYSTWVGRLLLGTVGALLLTVLAMSSVVSMAYGTMLPSRTAVGSALTLRTESFRRFLTSSEGQHVEWAWEQGVIREYSAWAVALDAADAWKRAIESSNIPERSVALSGPLLVHTRASSFNSAHTAPSSSSGGGGGFSGGAGGGGGGGSSGSW